jgi:hypothetical protein
MMSFKTVIAGMAAIAILAGTAFMPSAASAQRGHAFARGGFHPGVHPGVGFRGFRGFRGYGGWGFGIAPWWGYGYYPSPYYYGPACGYVRVRYYRHHRLYWHLVYVCR